MKGIDGISEAQLEGIQREHDKAVITKYFSETGAHDPELLEKQFDVLPPTSPLAEFRDAEPIWGMDEFNDAVADEPEPDVSEEAAAEVMAGTAEETSEIDPLWQEDAVAGEIAVELYKVELTQFFWVTLNTKLKLGYQPPEAIMRAELLTIEIVEDLFERHQDANVPEADYVHRLAKAFHEQHQADFDLGGPTPKVENPHEVESSEEA